MRFVFHRYNVPDPVLFYESIQVTVQHIGSMSPNARQKWLAAGRKIPCAGAATGFRMDESVEPWGLFEGQDNWSGFAQCTYPGDAEPQRALRAAENGEDA